jgi:hypothetical protein
MTPIPFCDADWGAPTDQEPQSAKVSASDDCLLTIFRTKPTFYAPHGSNDWQFAAKQRKAAPTTRTGLLDPT